MILSRPAFLLLAIATLASAQYGSQEISGFVLDSSGASVPRAKITAFHPATGRAREAQTDERGFFAFLDVQIGEYHVVAEADGFKRYVRSNVVVAVSAKVTLTIQLEVGDVRESVTVKSDPLAVDASSGEVGALITERQIADLQLNGRSFAQLLVLLPGVSTVNRSPTDLLGGYGSNNAQQSVNGSRRSTLSWNVDGVDNKDNGGDGNVFVRVNLDAIAEFKVLTSSYSAEYGQNSGAIVNMALKSGGRKFRGGLYGFTRMSLADGGGFLGGPIYIPHRFNSSREKLFFFASYDGFNWKSYAWIANSVPLARERAGDFSGEAAVMDPTTGVPFPNNIVPSSLIDRNTSRLLWNVPLSNTPGKPYQYVSEFKTPIAEKQGILKIDYAVNQKNRIAVHYMGDEFHALGGQTNLSLYDRKIPGMNASAKWTATPGARTVNTFQASISGNVIRQYNFRPNPEYTADVSRKGLEIDNPMVYGNAWEIPDMTIQAYNIAPVGARSWSNRERILQGKDDFTRVVGEHILKFGVLAIRTRKNQGNTTQVNGLFAFQTGHDLSSGNALADALLGNFSSYTEASGWNDGWFRFTQAEFYGQDNWKTTQRLSFNFGVRGHYMQPWYSTLANDVAFDRAYYNPASAVTVLSNGQIVPGSGDLLDGLALGGTGFPKAATDRSPGWSDPSTTRLFRGLPREIQSAQIPVAPRLGFAWDLTGKQNTVLRGAWGLFYERIQGNAVFNSVNNPPFIQRATLYNANIENPTGGKPVPLLPPDITSYPASVDTPTVQQFNLGIQHRLGRDMLLDASYVGNNAWHLYRTIHPNQLPLGTMLVVPEGTDPNSLRPYRGLGSITQFVTSANSNYNSLQVQFRKQMPSGGLVSLAYTWARNITDATDYNTVPQDSYNTRNDRGLSSYHRGHVLTTSYVYPLPWQGGRRWYRRLFGDWQTSGMVLLETGLPLDITVPGDPAGIAGTGGSLRPDLVGDWRADARRWDGWFNTAAFAVPRPGTFGNLGRNALLAPGVFNWDASFQKTIGLTERISAIVRLEYFNILDHVNYWGVDTNMASPRFGQVNATTDQRTTEAMLRFSF